MKMISDWLADRLTQPLSTYQLTCLSFIVKVSEEDGQSSLPCSFLSTNFSESLL